MDPEGLIESNWNDVVDNFDDMNLKEELLRGIYAYGFERPSAIQQRAILPCIKEHDVIAQAQSGKFSNQLDAFYSVCSVFFFYFILFFLVKVFFTVMTHRIRFFSFGFDFIT